MKAMTRRVVLSCGIVSFGTLAVRGSRAQGGGNWLVTSQEGTLPVSPTSKAGRAISRGPAIRQVSPAGPVSPNSPFAFRVEFVGRGGEKIDPASAQITLLRGNNINITQRLRAFISANGVEIPDAMVPPGLYVMQVAVSDAGGRQSLANIEIEAR